METYRNGYIENNSVNIVVPNNSNNISQKEHKVVKMNNIYNKKELWPRGCTSKIDYEPVLVLEGYQRRPKIELHGIQCVKIDDVVHSRTFKPKYTGFKYAIKPIVGKLLKDSGNSFLTEFQFHSLLNSIFQDKLEKIPINLEKYIILNSVRIQIYCEMCAVKISFFDSVEAYVRGVSHHVKDTRHMRNVQKMGQHFNRAVSNFDLNDTIFLHGFSSSFPDELNDQEKYFKAVLCLNFQCKLCNTTFQGYNKVKPIQNMIYNHINNESHVSKYVDTFPNLKYSLVCSQEVLKLSLDTIFDSVKTFVPKNMYLEILNKIYRNRLEKIPEGNQRYISIKLYLSLNCNLCMAKILRHNYCDLKNQVEMHIRGKKHYKLFKNFIATKCDTSRIVKYSEQMITDDMIKLPDSVLCELFSVISYVNYQNKVRQFINGNFIFDAECNICDRALVSTAELSSLEVAIDRHIYSNTHMSNFVKQIEWRNYNASQ